MGKYGRKGKKNKKGQGFLTSGDDEISKIPNDCCREICKYLDHHDLDEISTVSKRMYNFTVIGRSSTGKLKGGQLIIKETHGGLQVRLFQEPRHLSMNIFREINGKTGIVKYDNDKDWHFEYLSNPHRESLFPNAIYFISRYTLDVFRVENILIDHDFMNVVTLALRAHIREISFNQTPFIYTDESIAKRFLNLVLQSKSEYITLNIDGIAREFDADILQRFAATSINLIIEDKMTKTALVLDKIFSTSLCLFNSLVFDQLKVGIDWIVETIVKRLERKVWGKMSFTVNRAITEADVTKHLKPELGYEFDVPLQRHFIELNDTQYSVIFGTYQEPKTKKRGPRQWRLLVLFLHNYRLSTWFEPFHELVNGERTN